MIAQLDPRVEDPTDVDLHRVGTMAKLHKTVKMPNGNLVVFVEGLTRIRLAGLLSLKPFMRARVEAVPDLVGPRDTELAALERNARELFRDVVGRSPQLSDDLQTVAMNIDDPVRLADFIAANLPSLSTLLRQELLETADVRKRLETLDPRAVQGDRGPRAAQQDSGAGAGAGEPEPARVLVARADEGHPEGAGRIRRFAG